MVKKEIAVNEIKSHPVKYSLIAVVLGLFIYGFVVFLMTGNVLNAIERALYLFLLLLGGLLVQLIIKGVYGKIKQGKSKNK